MERNMKAIWELDYDYRTDKCYQRPMCPDCSVPIGKDEDGKYRCFGCGKEVAVDDPEMVQWFAKREETKIEMLDDPVITSLNGHTSGCGGKYCVETLFVRNHVTLEWQAARGECKNCGMRYIV